MNKTKKAKIFWLAEEDGGRKTPPLAGTRYCPIIQFESDKGEHELWSADFVTSHIDDDGSSIVDISYLADNAPVENLYSGNKFRLFEGNKLVATGEIL